MDSLLCLFIQKWYQIREPFFDTIFAFTFNKVQRYSIF